MLKNIKVFVYIEEALTEQGRRDFVLRSVCDSLIKLLNVNEQTLLKRRRTSTMVKTTKEGQWEYICFDVSVEYLDPKWEETEAISILVRSTEVSNKVPSIFNRPEMMDVEAPTEPTLINNVILKELNQLIFQQSGIKVYFGEYDDMRIPFKAHG